jgi:hypothetical protein
MAENRIEGAGESEVSAEGQLVEVRSGWAWSLGCVVGRSTRVKARMEVTWEMTSRRVRMWEPWAFSWRSG